jgi:macrolide-specific efflux system membrane fusion protein
VCRVAADETIRVDSVLIQLIDEVEVPARASGALSALLVSEGSRVARDDHLAQIDDGEVRLQQQQASYEYEIASQNAADDVEWRKAKKARAFAEADYLRLRRAATAQPRSVSQSELEKAKLESEQAALEQERLENKLAAAKLRQQLAAGRLALAKRQVELRRVTAPLDGVVVEVLRDQGEWVEPGQSIVRIVRTDRLRAEGFLEAEQVRPALQGSAVRLTLEADPGGRSFPGTVQFVSPEVDPVNGQVRFWADVENPSGRLRPGMRMRMSIDPAASAPSPRDEPRE